MSKELSPERTMLVGAALQGLIAAQGCGQSYSADPEQAIRFYSTQSVKLADAALEQMAVPMIPIPVKEVVIEETVIINR